MKAHTTLGPDAFAAASGREVSPELLGEVPLAYRAEDGSVWLLVGGSGNWTPQFDVAIGKGGAKIAGAAEAARVGRRLVITTNRTTAPPFMTLDFVLYSVQISGLDDEQIEIVELDGSDVNLLPL